MSFASISIILPGYLISKDHLQWFISIVLILRKELLVLKFAAVCLNIKWDCHNLRLSNLI